MVCDYALWHRLMTAEEASDFARHVWTFAMTIYSLGGRCYQISVSAWEMSKRTKGLLVSAPTLKWVLVNTDTYWYWRYRPISASV